MGLGARISLVAGNIAMLIPVFILLLVSAIMSAIGASNLAKLDQSKEVKNAHKLVSWSTVALWVLFGGGFVFASTIGLFIIPWMITIPYLYGGAMILFALINLVIAGILFYGANVAHTSKDYKNSDAAKSAYSNLLVCGILMVLGAIFMVGYSVFTMHKYRKAGGVTGDVAVAAQYGKYVAPEFAPALAVVGGAAEQQLSDSQKAELKQRSSQAEQLQQLGGAAQQATGKGGGGIQRLLKKPEVVEAVKNLMATKAM